MPNILTAGLAYDPYFYAREALLQLRARLGMATKVHRGFEAEKGQAKGSTIQIARPSKFTARNMPIAAADSRDLEPDYLNIVLDKWQGDQFKLSDKELAYTKEEIIAIHIAPLAYAIADAIDRSLNDLFADVPWFVEDDASTPTNDFPNIRERFFLSKAPEDQTGYYYEIDGVLQTRYEKAALFQQVNTAGDGGALQREGLLTRKFGFGIFANQNAPVQAAGTLNDTTPITNGTFAKGATVINLDDTTLTGILRKGNVLTITGHTQKYAVRNEVTAAGNALNGVQIWPPLEAALGDGVAVTVDQTVATSIGGAFHRNAFALAMAPLNMQARGVEVATVSDPTTGLVLRSRIGYSWDLAATLVGIDALWGTQTLDPNLAVRLRI